MNLKPWRLAVLLAGLGAMAGALPAAALYGGLGLGGSYLGNSDIKPAGGSESPSLDFCGDLSLGCQFESLFGVEAGWGFGPFRSFSFVGPSSMSLSTNQLFAMPLVRLGGGKGLFGSRAAYWVAGLKLGMATLDGQESGGGQSADFSGSAPVIGLAVRYETMIGGHFSVGLQAGYDYCKFSSFDVGGGPATKGGSDASLDFSGPAIKLMLAGWLTQPTLGKAAGAGPEKAKPAPASQPGGAQALAYRGQGDALMKARRYPEAVQAYYKAVQADPKNAGDWQALGNGYYYLGKKDYALSAYRTSLNLSGGRNKELEAFIKGLEGK